MKKISILLLSLLLVFTLVACGDNNDSSKDDSSNRSESSSAPKDDNYTFNYNGTKITMNAPADEIVSALGEPRSYTEEPSCAFEGLDKTYYYGSFYMTTYPLDGKDYVQSVWFADDSVATDEGIRIGNTQEAVEAAYGKDAFNGNNAFTVSKTDSTLTVILKDGKVTSIQYEIILK